MIMITLVDTVIKLDKTELKLSFTGICPPKKITILMNAPNKTQRRTVRK